MKINNKDIIQSYILTTAKYDYTVYEKRILYRLVEIFQSITKGQKLNRNIYITKDIFDISTVTIPVNHFLNGEQDKNHIRVKAAIENLENKKFIYEDDKTWEIIRIISEPKITKYNESVTFRINPKIVEAFANFSKGFRRIELETAMKFESVYAMRFYELLNEQKKPINYTIEDLKIMFQIEKKYKLTADFIKKVIDTAKKELTEKAPYTFDYQAIKTGRKITSIRFYPISQPNKRDKSIEERKLKKQVSPNWELDRITIQYLKENYLFTIEEIKNNIEILKEAQEKKEFDLLYFLSENKVKAKDKGNPKGWIINAIKNQIKK